MSPLLVQLSSVLGLSLASGINLYATVAVVGLVTKFDLIAGLPSEFQAFNNDFVIAVALALYTCEFLADKIPAFDSFWDSAHTAIRPFGAAMVAVTVVGDAHPGLEIVAGLVGASLGLATHTMKAGTRLAANTSPEPFSNVALSLGEDAAVVGMSVLVMSHPFLSLIVSLIVLVLMAMFGPALLRGALLLVKALPVRIGVALSERREPTLKEFMPDAFESRVDALLTDDEQVWVTQRAHARKVEGCGRNRAGFLLLTDQRLIFVYRRWFSTRSRQWDLSDLEQSGLNSRLLIDVLRVKAQGRFVTFLFLKSRSEAVTELAALLDEAVASRRELAPMQTGGKVLELNAARPAS